MGTSVVGSPLYKADQMAPACLLWTVQPQLDEEFRYIQIHRVSVHLNCNYSLPYRVSEVILDVLERLLATLSERGHGCSLLLIDVVGRLHVVPAGLAVDAVDKFLSTFGTEHFQVLRYATNQSTRSVQG